MSREEVYRDIEKTLGLVPSFMKELPDSTIEQEWEIFKRLQLSETHIPMKYKELIGLGVAAYNHCRYCTLFHTEAARMAGATDAEIEEAVHFAKQTAGWSTYLNGLQLNYDQFRHEMEQIVDFMRTHQMAEQPSTQPEMNA